MTASTLRSPLFHVVSAVVVLATVGWLGTGARATPHAQLPAMPSVDAGPETCRGSRLALSASAVESDSDKLRRVAEHQVDIVETTALDARAKAFLRGFPVTVLSGFGAGSHYSGGDGVTIAVEDPGDDSPILLHEIMRACHFPLLPGGKANPGIRTFYERARTGGVYRAGAYTRKNPQEFFAMTASVFLHGRLAREPFTHDDLCRKQPVYDRYLVRLFGKPGA